MIWVIILLVIGVMAGVIVEYIFGGKSSGGITSTILFGIIGSLLFNVIGYALIGSLLFNIIDNALICNILNLFISLIGATLFAFVWRHWYLRNKSISNDSQPPTEKFQTEPPKIKSEIVNPQTKSKSIDTLQNKTIENMSTENTTTKNSNSKPAIFITYRREDSSDVTGRIYDRLVQHFGKPSVFKDVDSIPLGVDFRKHLGDSVGQCDVLVAVIGRQWLSGNDGQSRLNELSDFVRVEIESALQRDIPVVPVLVQGSSIPKQQDLPDSLQSIVYRNGISVRPDPDFHQDMDRLIKGIEEYVKGKKHS